MSVFSDLASEARELHPELEGVSEEKTDRGGLSITRIRIEKEEAAHVLGKRMGSYVTIDAPGLIYRQRDLFGMTARAVSEELKLLMNGIDAKGSILFVGLGNRSVTPDALGPMTAEKVFVTRHINEYLPGAFETALPSLSVVAPGVLGTTGIETEEYIQSLAERFRPDAIIAVDSLSSRRASRIGTTVQLSDAGIDPGSGVGNIRKGLNRDLLGIPVFAIGVPLVVHARTVVSDAMRFAAEEAGLTGGSEPLDRLIDKVINDRMDSMILTPKEIDSAVADMSEIISEGVNRAVFGARYEEVEQLIV